ncbi:MAG TPA: toll/interleukin-1 receptor domain-containing protein [Planctomycetota bacterium]|nr:toll/interleukin-1 receptor domain-containing protein [Planctomycetota bacterium]
MTSDGWYDTVVIVTKGPHKGRIGYVDDADIHGTWVVCFGDPLRLPESVSMRPSSFRKANTNDLVERSSTIGVNRYGDDSVFELDKAIELLLVTETLWDLQYKEKFLRANEKTKIFISHSSADKPMVRRLRTDLIDHGIVPWLDEWDIKVGESIPKSISDALAICTYIIVVLTPNSVESKWVEHEWHDAFWDEVNERRIKVLPVVFEKCKIPPLLRTKKYADFTKGYSKALAELLLALG